MTDTIVDPHGREWRWMSSIGLYTSTFPGENIAWAHERSVLSGDATAGVEMSMARDRD